MFACFDGYLMGGSNKVNNRNRESGKGRGVDQQMWSKLPSPKVGREPTT